MNTFNKKTAVREAHSKLILVGEHAVVYGKPAIAMPFPLKVRAEIEEIIGPVILESNIYSGIIDSSPIKLKGLTECIKRTLNYLNKPCSGLRVKIDSTIPLGRGLGSSAASAAAIVRSIFSFYGEELTEEKLFTFVEIAETYAHGKASGIDMAAVSSSGPIWFQRGERVSPLSYGRPFYMIVADTGRIGDTRTAVENVRNRYILNPIKVQKSLDEIEKIVKEARNALISGDIKLLGNLLNRNQEELVSLGVSDDGLEELNQKARQAGALGAKLTGGGMGGCILAIAACKDEAEAIASELIKGGAAETWYFSTEEELNK
jgi:mevalonate kinase